MIAWIYSRPRSKYRATRAGALADVDLFTVGDAGWHGCSRERPAIRSTCGLRSWRALFWQCSFSLPAKGGWGFRVTRARWCQAGSFAAARVSFRLRAGASRGDSARQGVRGSEATSRFVAWARCRFRRRCWIGVTRFGLLTALYEAQFDLRDCRASSIFDFIPDSPPDRFYRARFRAPRRAALLAVRAFPVDSAASSRTAITWSSWAKIAFQNGHRRGPQPFTYRVVFDDAGNLIEQGWLTNGMLRTPHEANGAAAARAAATPKKSP